MYVPWRVTAPAFRCSNRGYEMSRAVGAEYDFSLLKILVVDDSKNMHKLMQVLLSAMGVRNIQFVYSGDEAIEELRRFDADLVICDWNMAPMDGLTFTRNIRSNHDSPNPYVPIIMLTGHTETERVKEARDAGINLFLAKPVSVKALSDRILSLIDHPRPFVRTAEFVGPDRRRRDRGPPEGRDERRK